MQRYLRQTFSTAFDIQIFQIQFYDLNEMAIKPCSCADYVLAKQNVNVNDISLMRINYLIRLVSRVFRLFDDYMFVSFEQMRKGFAEQSTEFDQRIYLRKSDNAKESESLKERVENLSSEHLPSAKLNKDRPSTEPFEAYSSERIPELEEAKKNFDVAYLALLIRRFLAGNNISLSAFKVFSKELKSVEYLDLQSNPIAPNLTSDTLSGFSDMKQLFLGDCGLSHTDGGTFKAMRELRALRLDKNKIRTIEDGTLKRFTKIGELHLPDNQLKSVPDLPGIQALGVMTIFNNPVTMLPLEMSHDMTPDMKISVSCKILEGFIPGNYTARM
ncbi:Slit-like 3 protein [Stylophora pistillata]|uniref:Slit-like 3 protein n=1 Tax=Stylophora pistillata TaxID=50429 RepID=A0A2B4S437_STYPI|nr:Slit-like 3 protein [Stylophora pistillata]